MVGVVCRKELPGLKAVVKVLRSAAAYIADAVGISSLKVSDEVVAMEAGHSRHPVPHCRCLQLRDPHPLVSLGTSI